MSNREQLIRARVGILTMAVELKNVAKACKLAGVSRSQFYAMKKAYETYGREGLAPRLRRKPRMPNRTPAAIEGHIMKKTHASPTVSYIKLAEQMKEDGIGVTPTMVRYVWQRLGLSTRAKRLQWVKRQNERLCVENVKGADQSLEVGPAACVHATSPPPPVSVADAV